MASGYASLRPIDAAAAEPLSAEIGDALMMLMLAASHLETTCDGQPIELPSCPGWPAQANTLEVVREVSSRLVALQHKIDVSARLRQADPKAPTPAGELRSSFERSRKARGIANKVALEVALHFAWPQVFNHLGTRRRSIHGQPQLRREHAIQLGVLCAHEAGLADASAQALDLAFRPGKAVATLNGIVVQFRLAHEEPRRINTVSALIELRKRDPEAATALLHDPEFDFDDLINI
ncbi:MAG: hypothetical protein RIT81_42835 [Deltaproteobacteria bacterium]